MKGPLSGSVVVFLSVEAENLLRAGVGQNFKL